MEEIMKNTLFYIGGAIAFSIAVGYIIYKQVVKTNGDNNVSSEDNDTDGFKKKYIKTLSYELLVKEVKSMMQNIDLSQIQEGKVLSMAVTPNKLSQQFFQMPHTKALLKALKITEDEKAKMVILSINAAEKTLVSEVIIADIVTDDYYDFVPDDKIYIKKISIAK